MISVDHPDAVKTMIIISFIMNPRNIQCFKRQLECPFVVKTVRILRCCASQEYPHTVRLCNTCINIHTYTYIYISLSLSLYIYILYIYTLLHQEIQKNIAFRYRAGASITNAHHIRLCCSFHVLHSNAFETTLVYDCCSFLRYTWFY